MLERILVVEDEAVRETLVSMLRSAHYECHGAGNGLEALALLDSGKQIEMVLCKLRMPNLDGLGLLERLQDKNSDIQLVVTTPVEDVSIALVAIRNGAYDYLLKPFDREQLLNTVSRALENRRLKVENRTYQTNLESLVKARTEQLQTVTLNLEKSYDTTLEALGDALDRKEASTEGHSRRVTAFTIVIAKAMGLPTEQIPIIARSAFLHDIGKLAIPDAILRKPGKLTPDEMIIMQEHCFKGYQIVKKIPFLVDACDIVYSHQERYDGTGYPRGLKGDQIPLGARIVAVANTLDSITSDLPYRPKQSYQAAREEIIRWSGRQFDQEVVKAFLEIPEDIWDRLRHGINSEAQRH
jgi:response regulator RpfG family c-di-GMP phosphodiesterase